jgi:hypothetical protein
MVRTGPQCPNRINGGRCAIAAPGRPDGTLLRPLQGLYGMVVRLAGAQWGASIPLRVSGGQYGSLAHYQIGNDFVSTL